MNGIIYFRFVDAPIARDTKKNISWFGKIAKLLLFFIPRSNPDFDEKYELVATWYIEYDNGNQYVNREIGLDEGGQVIVKGPLGKNLGFWTDSNVTIEDYKKWKIETIALTEFEALWNKNIQV